MTDALPLFAALIGLLAYGTSLASRIAGALERHGDPRPSTVGPWIAAAALRRYGALSEDDDSLPRLHRSLRLNRALTALTAVAACGRVLLF